VTMADALSRLTRGMMGTHEQTCDIPEPHRWERCTSTPAIYAVADALDVLDAAPELSVAVLADVAIAMHNRECEMSSCSMFSDPQAARAHAYSWRDQATALLNRASRERGFRAATADQAASPGLTLEEA
jgi:hypothetical protein